MAKQLIRLTEGDLHKIIAESVKKILKENEMEEGAGRNVLKRVYDDVKNATPEQIDKWDKSWHGKNKGNYKNFIKGKPNAQQHHNLKYNRENNLDGANDTKELVTQPGLSGKLKRGAVSGAMSAMLGARKLSDKIKQLRNKKNDSDYQSFTM